MLEVTNRCQLHCITCPREYGLGARMDKGHMDVGKAKSLIDSAHTYLDRIALTGLGEPFLYPHLVELVEHISGRNRGLSIFVSTNAQHPGTAELAGRLADRIDTLQISIDGCGEVFESIRKGASYGRFLENLGAAAWAARGRRMDVVLNMVVVETNVGQMGQVVELAAKHGVGEVRLGALNHAAIESQLGALGFYVSAGFREALGAAGRSARRFGVELSFPRFDGPSGFRTCPFPWGNFYVSWDGYLAACCSKPFPKELHFGNVFEDGLLECINHAGFVEMRRMWLKDRAPGFCEGCGYLG